MEINGKEIKINRKDAVVRDFDKQYCELLKKILEEGELFENRTGVDTLSIPGGGYVFDVGNEFPILESKKIMLKNALSELLWIYQVQTNVVSWLRERGNNIWNEWEVDSDGIYRIYESTTEEYDEDKEVNVYDLDGNIIIGMKAKSNIEGKNIKAAKYFGKEFAGTIGTAYGYIIKKYKRLDYVINALINNPHDRRMVISLWQDADLRTAVLPSCVWSNEYKVYKGTLNCFVDQRSADVPLGLPFNISQYAILMLLLAKVSGLQPGKLYYNIADAHIYVNQIDGIKKQLANYEKMLKFEKIINENSDIYLEEFYNALKSTKEEKEEYLNNNPDNEEAQDEFNDAKKDLQIFELMITKKKPTLELADKKNFYEFSNQVNNDKEYLKENVTGNEDIKVLNYSSAPFIKMPVAQ
jgi:thymidylate synthase